jgi:hypothetical protein
MPSPNPGRYPPSKPGVIPSSNLARNGGQSANQGTPDAVLRAINSRKEERANDRSELYGETKPTHTPSSSSTTRYVDGSSPPSKPRTPSLVAAAQASAGDSDHADFIGRMTSQFKSVPRSAIIDLVRRYPNDKAKVINGARMLTRDAKNGGPATEPPASLYVPVAKVQSTPVKSSKEQSAIYGKRGKGKKRDGSESESEGNMSDAESEMDWSDEGGPKKKKRKNDVMQPEEVAFKAFNEISAEELTGTICTSDLRYSSVKLISSLFCRASSYNHQEPAIRRRGRDPSQTRQGPWSLGQAIRAV